MQTSVSCPLCGSRLTKALFGRRLKCSPCGLSATVHAIAQAKANLRVIEQVVDAFEAMSQRDRARVLELTRERSELLGDVHRLMRRAATDAAELAMLRERLGTVRLRGQLETVQRDLESLLSISSPCVVLNTPKGGA